MNIYFRSLLSSISGASLGGTEIYLRHVFQPPFLKQVLKLSKP